MTDPIVEKFTNMSFVYGDQDDDAYERIARRVAKLAKSLRASDNITYSAVADGIEFHLPSVKHGNPYKIDIYEWTELDRNIIGSFLGRLSAESYRRGRILASALVVGKETNRPSEGFFRLCREVGLLTATRRAKEEEFWVLEMNKALDWYRLNDW